MARSSRAILTRHIARHIARDVDPMHIALFMWIARCGLFARHATSRHIVPPSLLRRRRAPHGAFQIARSSARALMARPRRPSREDRAKRGQKRAKIAQARRLGKDHCTDSTAVPSLRGTLSILAVGFRGRDRAICAPALRLPRTRPPRQNLSAMGFVNAEHANQRFAGWCAVAERVGAIVPR